MKSIRLLLPYLLISTILLPASAPAQKLSKAAVLQKIDSLFSSQQGHFALAFRDIGTGRELLYNAHEIFHAASTMKTPVQVEIFSLSAKGLLNLNEPITLKNSFTSIADSSTYQLDSTDDSESDLYRHIGQQRTVRELVYQMITVSSNFATNLLIDRVGAANIVATMHSLGLDEVHVVRGVEDDKAFRKGMNNTVTAAGLMNLFQQMAEGSLISRAASDSMIHILLDQHFNDIIPARLPAGVKVAHKTGWITGNRHDSGIVILPNGKRNVLELLSKD